ncbi:uncharacterized protein LOC141852022 [Brevipalpus obovatus]|uniref:uncharacterized protein LOC141852022 n=1 Tax=Brevipalpus obovatus TaxID=246614 RepID=UPI003D9DF519
MMIPMVILLVFSVAKINYVDSLQLAERDIKDLCLDSLGMVEMGFKQDYVIDTMEKVFDKKYQYEHPEAALTLTERALLRSLIDLMTQIKFSGRSRPSSESPKSTSSGYTSYPSRGPGGSSGNIITYPGSENKIKLELSDEQMGSGSALIASGTWSTGKGEAQSKTSINAANSMNKVYNSDATLAFVRTKEDLEVQSSRKEPAYISIRKAEDEPSSPPVPMWRGSTKESGSKTHSAITKSAAVKQTCNSINFPASLDSDNYSQWAASIQSIQTQIAD